MSIRPRSHRSIRYMVFAIRFALRHRQDSATSTLHQFNVTCGGEQIVQCIANTVQRILLCEQGLRRLQLTCSKQTQTSQKQTNMQVSIQSHFTETIKCGRRGLLHKVKTQYVHFRLHTILFPQKIPEEIGRRSIFFNN